VDGYLSCLYYIFWDYLSQQNNNLVSPNPTDLAVLAIVSEKQWSIMQKGKDDYIFIGGFLY
jgi:hypothetical protein